ncbi:MAG: hypothetical protein EON94_13855, partial [Caulobacteraceae bacterium]
FSTELAQGLESEAWGVDSARLKAAVQLVGLSSYVWDPQTGALQWDERLKALWDLPADAAPDELLWMQGIHPDDRARVRAAADQAIRPDGDGTYAVEYRVVGLQGASEHWVSTFGQARRGTDARTMRVRQPIDKKRERDPRSRICSSNGEHRPSRDQASP